MIFRAFLPFFFANFLAFLEKVRGFPIFFEEDLIKIFKKYY